MFQSDGSPREACTALNDRLRSLTNQEILRRQFSANRAMVQSGITFNVYGEEAGRERIIPFDILPRVVGAKDWEWIELGLKQRIQALNFFLQDIYNEQRILNEGVIPRHVIESSATYRKQCVGLTPPQGIWCHITGTDLVRDADGQFYILEDNLRCPSGVSYVLQNRQLVKKTFPQLFAMNSILPVDDYPGRLLCALSQLMQDRVDRPVVGLLSPGSFNSAFFEHSFLASQMGIDLVEGRDLVVQDGFVFMRTTQGFEKIDVLYRRIDDDFLDPDAFRADSMLGVRGLMESYRTGRVALANAPGTGVADDKVVYSYVPDMIKFYLAEEPLIPNVPTYLCFEDAQRQHVLENMENLVVKPVNESGGYGLLIGPNSTEAERADLANRIKEDPRGYIAQPVLSLSRAPVLTDDGPQGRHVDLRPFIVFGEDIYVLPGGLTRVALKKGSLVVNSSQGGGSKDTWVVK
ncbi:MAG: circularly permuted type 2 ATP-grasp protein [Planctomycetota bacterium]